VHKDFFGSRWICDIEQLMAGQRVLFILLATVTAWFKLYLALVQLSTHSYIHLCTMGVKEHQTSVTVEDVRG